MNHNASFFLLFSLRQVIEWRYLVLLQAERWPEVSLMCEKCAESASVFVT
jgi:hypothetical protein